MDFGLQPLLFGAQNHPFLSINVANLDISIYNKETQEALSWVLSELDKNTTAHTLEQGDCFYVNNLSVVHARDSYNAKFDGYGRWLCRIVTSFDINRSRQFRSSFEDRVVSQNIY